MGSTGTGMSGQWRREGIVQSVVLAAITMAVIDGIVVSIALPSITRDFFADVAQ